MIKLRLFGVGVLGLLAVGLPGAASAQSGSSLILGNQPFRVPKTVVPPAAPLAPKPDPRQRLDAGALLCPTEADLEQHEAAVAARLDGREASDPVGCRHVSSMIAVSILDRHGPARTQVKLAAHPEQTGWTDAVVRDRQ